MKRVVTIGGGTGRFTLLLGLKRCPVEISAIVTMSDNGGSTGRLRDELGVLPPGDVRQCLVALSGSALTMRKMMSYRFDKGELAGHNFGNILIATLEKVTGSLERALALAGAILNIKGRVIPVTYGKANLVAELNDGTVLKGEDALDTSKKVSRAGVKKMYIKPRVKANPHAIKAIREADLLIVGPGDLYTSLIPNFLVDGVREAFLRSKAKKVYIANLMNLKGHTDEFSVSDYLNELESFIGKEGIFDVVICNTRKPSPALLKRYRKEGTPVICDMHGLAGYDVKHVDVLASGVAKISKADKLRRVLIRHDPDKLARVLMRIMNEKR